MIVVKSHKTHGEDWCTHTHMRARGITARTYMMKCGHTWFCLVRRYSGTDLYLNFCWGGGGSKCPGLKKCLIAPLQTWYQHVWADFPLNFIYQDTLKKSSKQFIVTVSWDPPITILMFYFFHEHWKNQMCKFLTDISTKRLNNSCCSRIH